MAKQQVRNISPLGDLTVPLLGGRVVAAGEVVEVPSDIAAALLEQGGVWERVTSKTSKGGES